MPDPRLRNSKSRVAEPPPAQPPIEVALSKLLVSMVDRVGQQIDPPEQYTQMPQTYDRLGEILQRLDQRFDQLEQRQQQGCFNKMFRKPLATIVMFITGILLAIGCAYLFHFSVLNGCLYSQKELATAIARQDYGTMELYSQQVSRLCSLNNKLRLAIFDHFGRIIDGISPSGLVQQVLGSVFGLT